MTHALWGVLLLSLATNTQAVDGRTGATAPPVEVNSQAVSRANPTHEDASPTGPVSKSARPSEKVSENYTADMTACRRMVSTARSSCEREMHAARAQGLYRE